MAGSAIVRGNRVSQMNTVDLAGGIIELPKRVLGPVCNAPSPVSFARKAVLGPLLHDGGAL